MSTTSKHEKQAAEKKHSPHKVASSKPKEKKPPARKAESGKKPAARKAEPEKKAESSKKVSLHRVTSKKPKSEGPSAEQARKGAEKVVGSLIRVLLASRRRNYLEGIKIEKQYYATALFEESRKTYTRYLDAEQKERILKIDPVAPATVHVYTSGEGMGKNRYTCAFEKKAWLIAAIDVMCGDCGGAGSCRWCEGKGCLDCQSTGRCVPCSGTGWAKWAK